MRTVLDAEAVVALLGPGHPSRRQVRAASDTSERLGRRVCIPTVTMAELYRGRGRSASLDALLAGQGLQIFLRDTDRELARPVGSLLHDARLSSEHLVDAHAVAVALEGGGGVVLTGDPDDLTHLAAPYVNVTVVALRDSRG